MEIKKFSQDKLPDATDLEKILNGCPTERIPLRPGGKPFNIIKGFKLKISPTLKTISLHSVSPDDPAWTKRLVEFDAQTHILKNS